MIKMNPMAPLMCHPAMLTPFPIDSLGVVGDAGVATGGAGQTRPWMLAAGALVVGVTAAAAVAWHSASADGDPPEQGMTTSAPTQAPHVNKSAAQAPVAHKSVEPARQHAAVQAPVCRQCGTVESVQAISHKGEGSGLGAVAGGVVGGALGSQVGKGDGRTAMTVLGAIGGGLAGNEVEKRAKAVTRYRVSVKMEDGSVHVLEQAQAPTVGQRVRVEGQTLQALPREG
jgi:outer membrane lipoprotein SlyB